MARSIISWAGAALALAFAAAPASAAEHVVNMLTRGSDGTPMVFEPAYLRIAPGDTVRFVPVQPGHNAESIEGMIPAGAEPFKNPFNVETTVTFTVEGVYGYKCLPHYGMGMVGVIQVGAPANLDAAKAVTHSGRAGEVFTGLLAEVAN